jgi:tetratricopeptide (TPR) repeat protein
MPMKTGRHEAPHGEAPCIGPAPRPGFSVGTSRRPYPGRGRGSQGGSQGPLQRGTNEFSEALQAFKDAYRLYPDPVFLYNLGQCERQLNHEDEAIRFYRSFLRNMPKAPNKAEVQRKIDELEAAAKSKPASEAQAVPASPPPAKPGPPQAALGGRQVY